MTFDTFLFVTTHVHLKLSIGQTMIAFLIWVSVTDTLTILCPVLLSEILHHSL